MAYVDGNPKSKKQLREWVAEGKTVTVFQPGPFGPTVADGTVALEGPHYPKPHSWYASAIVKDGVIVKIKA